MAVGPFEGFLTVTVLPNAVEEPLAAPKVKWAKSPKKKSLGFGDVGGKKTLRYIQNLMDDCPMVSMEASDHVIFQYSAKCSFVSPLWEPLPCREAPFLIAGAHHMSLFHRSLRQQLRKMAFDKVLLVQLEASVKQALLPGPYRTCVVRDGLVSLTLQTHQVTFDADNSFVRLVIHCMCRYYLLSSSSVMVKNEKHVVVKTLNAVDRYRGPSLCFTDYVYL